MKFFIRRLSAIIFLFLSTLLNISAGTYYISLLGDDSHTGTMELPFKTIEKGIAIAVAGDTIFVRGGTYNILTTLKIAKIGNENENFHLMAYTGERVLLDCSGQALSGSNRGVLLTGSYWHIEGFDISGAGDNGMKIEKGSYNQIVNCAFYRNRDSGLQIGNGSSNNRIINCDSYYNADPPDFGDADGFAAKLDVGTENYFSGCRAWKNCDDGWDGYLRGTDNVSTIIENCWAFENGYLEDGTDPGPQANGNGFKMGGSDDKTLSHNYTLKNCLSFKNKGKGFDQNSNMGSMILYNCSGHNNIGGNYVIYKALAAGKELVIKNSLVLGEPGNIASFAIQQANSWMGSFSVSEADFISINESEAYGARNKDGSLPGISYLQLAEGSDLINAGVGLGLPFYGPAPDLGCFESTYDINIGTEKLLKIPAKFSCYPNPASERVSFEFTTESRGEYTFKLFDLTGKVKLQTNPVRINSASVKKDVLLPDLPAGIYFYQLEVDNKIFACGKLMIK
jgi:hypothetical protein